MFKTKLCRKRVWLAAFIFIIILAVLRSLDKSPSGDIVQNQYSYVSVDLLNKDVIISGIKDSSHSSSPPTFLDEPKGEEQENHPSTVNKITTEVSERPGYNKMTFDIDLVTDSFKSCHENNLDLSAYVVGYSEIYNFFNVLGTVFGFIASDVREKLDILENLRTDKSDEQAPKYAEVELMMTFEIERNKQSDKELFGSRTLLRLHRALEFTKLFLEQLGEMDDSDKVSTMAKDVYHKTLAKFHPWLIRNAASLALYSLPSRKDLIKKIAPTGIDEKLLKEKISACTEKMQLVYSDIDSLYSKYSLHELP